MSSSIARQEAIQAARTKIALKPVYLDTETTGAGFKDEIIEIGIISDTGEVLFESLVKPVGRITPDAYRVHGIGDDLLAGAPRWMHVWPQVEAVLAGRQVAIYNADFDLRMMQQTHALYKMRWRFPGEAFCVMKLYAQFYGEYNPRMMDYKWQSLENAGKQCGISLNNTHRATDDVLLTRALLQYMAEQ
ncbi:MAG: exonuclease domain-containing protein [Chloroflexota bacterium]